MTGGKPYYLAGLYPALLAAGSLPVVRWLRTRTESRRRTLVALGLVLSLPNLVLMLPLLPARSVGPILAVNYDLGETIGWPELSAVVGSAWDALPAAEHPVVLTGNYGQAGAIERYRPDIEVYSGHNAYADWGPPPPTATAAVIVGYPRNQVASWCQDPVRTGTIDNGIGIDNDEQGTPVWTCRTFRADWARLWPDIRHLD